MSTRALATTDGPQEMMCNHNCIYFFGNTAIAILQFINLSLAIQKNQYMVHVNKPLLFTHPTCLFYKAAGLTADGLFMHSAPGLRYQIHSLIATQSNIDIKLQQHMD